METNYHGFFVGPAADREVLEQAAAAAGLADSSIVETRGGVWAFTEVESRAEALARALETWVWEAELRNDFDADPQVEKSHSGRVVGRVWRALHQSFELRVDDELHEEGLILGGVMHEVAFEYVRWYAKNQASAEVCAPPSPRVEEVDEQALASALIEHLLSTGDLEVVNHHARRTLTEPIAACLDEGSPARAAARISAVLEDADEVVDLYAEDAVIEAFLRGQR